MRPIRTRTHGGPDARGPARWDFSTNVNAAGPCPQAVQALARSDPTRYPDPDYRALRERLAARHGVDPERILVAASASEFIQRITAVGQRLAPGPVAVPALAYGDYAVAARACGRPVLGEGSGSDAHPVLGNGSDVRRDVDAATLRWCADPGSPLGQNGTPPAHPAATPTVLDAAYAPLRLSGASAWSPDACDSVFRLYSPNKAMGLPGIRGSYAVAPARAHWPLHVWCDALRAAEPSWPLGAHAVALLECWTDAATQTWLADARGTLASWTCTLRAGLNDLGLHPAPSVTPFLCARMPPAMCAACGPDVLLEHGLAVRDAASFGLPGWMRVSAQPPQALQALLSTLASLVAKPNQPPAEAPST